MDIRCSPLSHPLIASIMEPQPCWHGWRKHEKNERNFVWTLQISGKMVVRKEVLVHATMEFPRMNYAFSGRENKFFYAVGHEYLHPNRVKKTVVFQYEFRPLAVEARFGEYSETWMIASSHALNVPNQIPHQTADDAHS